MSDDEEYDSDEEITWNDKQFDGKKNVGIILIDVCSSMFDAPRPFKMCLLAAYQIMDRMLLKAYHRNFSICLLRDEDVVLTALSDNLITSTKKILSLLQTSIEDLRSQFERKGPASLRYTLTDCMKQFNNLEKVNPYIVILTNDEDPHRGDKNENLSAIDVGISFKEMNVKLVLLPVKEKFNYGLFYGELLKAANDVPLDIFDEESEQSYTSVDDLNDVLDCVIKDKVNIRRFMFRLYKNSEKEVFFWAQIRYLVNNIHLNQNVNISRSTNNIVKQAIRDQANIDLDKWTFCKSGSKEIEFSRKDCLSLKMPFGFRLLYVSNEKQSSIHHLDKRGFLLQNDELVEGNKKQNIFDYMWEYCKDKNRFLICGFHVPGNKQHPNIVELTPDTFQSKPCFIGVYLGNYDDVTVFPTEEDEELEEDKKKFDKNDPELGLVCDMIDKMKLKKFEPYHWNDMKYESKAAHIKAQILDIEVQNAECCFPTEDEVTEQLGATNTELVEIFGVTVDPPATKRSRKK